MDMSEEHKIAQAGVKREKSGYVKIVNKGSCNYMYMKIEVQFEKDYEVVLLSIEEFRLLVGQCLQNMFGDVGAAIQVDILKYDTSSMAAILRVPSAGYVQLRSALTLCSNIQDRSCAIHVVQASAHLMALAFNSREVFNQ